ncbi:ExbD/TolR family protein [Flavobacterium sharifuzzamanii]|uniref:ExbD/TolR family protein n=1 Tax=Flavobacterium sharifuzzamanii TaxID=2211133 RepID=UPI000DADA76A|nr:biopolymer transporter ExbD [Flavobacterium sharifuzzamanii]KAF2080998.1 biopolymer transporter ExbD [Flavobacterium sharifuzzamanii]
MKNLPQKVRSKKLNSRVDLTAMVSVSFLLIIFFMVVGELSKPKQMKYDTGQDRSCCDCPPRQDGENRSITLILGENNKLICYVGVIASPIKKPKTVAYGKNGIRKELTARIESLKSYYSDSSKLMRDLVVVIKPTKKSNYGNLVDILDEMKITGITSYYIVPEFTPEESKLLASN